MHKYVNLADLVKSFTTSIYLQTSASIQPRTFWEDSIHLFIRHLRKDDALSFDSARLNCRAGARAAAGHLGCLFWHTSYRRRPEACRINNDPSSFRYIICGTLHLFLYGNKPEVQWRQICTLKFIFRTVDFSTFVASSLPLLFSAASGY